MENHWLIFRVGGQSYGLEDGAVIGILECPAQELPPNAVGCPDGVIELDHYRLPVLDLRRRLKIAPTRPADQHYLVITYVSGLLLALLVDTVIGKVPVPAACIVDTAPETAGVRCVARLGNQRVALLNCFNLLSAHEVEALQEQNRKRGSLRLTLSA